MSEHHQILVVGGGTAGITTAAHLLRQNPDLDIAIIEPSEKHYYQPLWTLIGAGVFKPEASQRDEASLIPYGAKWIKDRVTAFKPDARTVETSQSGAITYDYLIVAAGIQINWDGVKGLRETLGKNGVCSNYSFETVGSTWDNIKNLKQGRAIFTQPTGAVKCGGAPQKICYLAEDYFRKAGVRDNIEVMFAAAVDRIFAVPRYADILEKVVERKNIVTQYRHNLIEVKADSKVAVFEHLDTQEKVEIEFDMLHVTPPMGPPTFIAESPLADQAGWVDVDQFTLQHRRFPEVFSIGDAASLPTSKTGAAIRKQAPVLVENLLAQMEGKELAARYDGYTSCPVVTGFNSLVLAEFNYDKQTEESFPFDQAKERFSMLMLKKYALPALYWHGMLRGRA